MSDLAPELDGFLSDPASYDLPAEAVIERVETHAAVVFLAGEHAYKVKKPVDYGYLDFSDEERRHKALMKELVLNQALAPHIYLDVLTIRRTREAHLSFQAVGPVVDYVLKMARFDGSRLLSKLAERGALSHSHVRDAAAKTAQFHARAAPLSDAGGAKKLRAVLTANEGAQREHLPPFIGEGRVETLIAKTRERFDQSRRTQETRKEAGLVRHVHGDLHLDNMFAEGDGEVTLFDRLEFDDALATIDVLYDFAFFLMDLQVRGLEGEAGAALEAYRGAWPADEVSPFKHGGEAVLPLFIAMRAGIRAFTTATHASKIGGRERERLGRVVQDYTTLALQTLDQ